MNIEKKLNRLRDEYKKYPEKRVTIILQVSVLQLGKKYPKLVNTIDPFVKNAKEVLL